MALWPVGRMAPQPVRFHREDGQVAERFSGYSGDAYAFAEAFAFRVSMMVFVGDWDPARL
jgi:hypothetical protein